MDKLYINLTPFQSLRGNILVGKMAGEYARMLLKLDEVDKWVKKNPNLEVEIQFPDGVGAITDSFLKGLLQGTFDTLGYDTFVARIKFHTNNEVLGEDFESDISEFIQLMKAIKG